MAQITDIDTTPSWTNTSGHEGSLVVRQVTGLPVHCAMCKLQHLTKIWVREKTSVT